MGQRLPILVSALSICLSAKSYDRILRVGPSGFPTIQAAVNACQSSERCAIYIDPGLYPEQVTIHSKKNMWLRGADSLNPPIVRWLDTISTQPKDVVHALGENNWAYYAERNGVIRVVGESDSVRISYIKIDAARHFSFQWENVWGSRWQFNGNSAIAISGAHAVQVDHCEIQNAFWGIRFKDRNTGGVFANLDLWEIESQAATATPFSHFGKYGGHLFEYNRIHSNVWGFYAEQTWDLPSTIRFNLIYHNRADTSADFRCINRNICGVPDHPQGDRQYHAGGFLFLKDAMLTPHIIYNNTLYGNPQTIAGYYKAGKNHIVFNNIVDQHTERLDSYPLQSQSVNIFYGYTNAHHNVISSNGLNAFGLMGRSDELWVKSNLAAGGTPPVDSFIFPAGWNNFWYQVPEFQSTNPASPLFLCPDWSKAPVQRAIAGKAWNGVESRGVLDPSESFIPEAGDIGALWQNRSGCRQGGIQDSIGIHLSTQSPMLFSNLTDARFQFRITPLNAHDSDFTDITYHYTAYVDSMPFPATGNLFTAERSPVPGLTGALKMGHNDIRFTFPRASLGEYGVMRYSVRARHRNGKIYVSNLDVVEYRRLKYTLSIRLFNNSGQPVDTVVKGDTVRALVKILDIQLNELSGGLVLSHRTSFLNATRAQWIDDFPIPIRGSASARFVVTSYQAAEEILNMGGIVAEIRPPADTLKYFISGVTPFYIKPSNAAQLAITNTQLAVPQNEPFFIQVDVRDVFGDLTDERVVIRVQTEQGDAVTPLPQLQTNSRGKLSFPVTPIGAIGRTFTITASVEGRPISSQPVTFTIAPPINRKVIITNKPGHYRFATGEIIHLDLQLVDGQGKPLAIQDFFGLAIRDSLGATTSAVFLYDDSAAAASEQNGRNSGQFAMTIPQTGKMSVYLRVPATQKTSALYTIQTTNTNFSNPVVFDTAQYAIDVPQLVFVDQNGRVLDSPPVIDTITGTLIPLAIQARVGNAVCAQCRDTLPVASAFPQIRFKMASDGPDVTRLVLRDGIVEFLIYGARQVLNGEYSLNGRNGVMTLRHEHIHFRKPPVPQADSAAVYDRNGDGIADSLVIWYGESIRDSLPDTLVYAWPAAATARRLIPLSAHLLSDSVLVITGNLTENILTQGTGKLLSIYQDRKGQWWTQRLDIADRIGPVLKRVALVQSWTGLQDTLMVTFSEALDTSVVQGNVFILNGNFSFPLASRGVQISDTTWFFLVERQRVQVGNALSLAAVNSQVRDWLENAPHSRNRAVEVSLIRRPIPPSQNGNFLLDRDGDGTLDHISIKLLGNVSQEYLDRELDSVIFTWINRQGQVIAIRAPGREFSIDSRDSSQILWKVPDTLSLYPFLTSMNQPRFAPYGSAVLYATLSGEPQMAFPVRLRDAMAPVIRQAILKVSSDGKNEDLLTISFSEPVDWASADEKSLIEIKARGETSILRFSDFEWKDSSTLLLYFGSGIPLNLRPSSQDSVRLRDGSLKDAAGNRVPDTQTYAAQNGSNSQRPFTMIIGDFRFKIASVTQAQFHPEDPQIQKSPPIEILFRPFKSTLDKKRDAGMAVDLGSRDLQHSVQQAIKARYFSRDDSKRIEDIPVKTRDIKIQAELFLYTNLSDYVAHHSIALSCDDRRFSANAQPESSEGNCLEYPAQLFLRWNFKSAQGRLVASGAYFARLRLKISYTGEYPVSVTSIEKLESWGVWRSLDTKAMR